MNFGCEQQRYKMTKTGDEINVNVCGWNIGTHDKFKELFKFLMRSKNTITQMSNRMFHQLSQDAYVK